MGSKNKQRTEQRTNNESLSFGGSAGDESAVIAGSNNHQEYTHVVDNSVTEIDNSFTDNSVMEIDNSDNSVTEIDNSDNSVTEIDQSQTDNSVTEIDNSDNSHHDSSVRYEGEYAGVGGNVTVTDGGAFEVVGDALEDITATTAALSRDSSAVSNKAIDSMENVAVVTAAEMRSLAENVTDNVIDKMESFGNSVLSQSITGLNENSEKAMQTAADAMNANAKLIQTTNLQGQDIIAEKSVSLAKWFGAGAIALAAGGVLVFVRVNRG